MTQHLPLEPATSAQIPLQVVAALGLLYREVGLALLPGVGVILAMLWANRAIAQRTFKRQSGLLVARDQRVKHVRELLGAIKPSRSRCSINDTLICDDTVVNDSSSPTSTTLYGFSPF